MEVGSPEWIETSLARLDELEQERAEHEAAIEEVKDPLTLKQHTEALSRLDDEIKVLYAQLEAVAEDDDDEEGEGESQADAPAAPRATQGDDEISAPHAAAKVAEPAAAAAEVAEPAATEAAAASAPEANPFAAPASDPGDPFGSTDPTPIITDDDLKPKGGGAKWAFVGVVVALAVGVGGFFGWQQMQKNQPEPEPEKGPPKVIKAAEIPPDTENPNAAKGADVDRSPSELTRGSGDGGNNGGGGGGGNNKKKGDGKERKKIELGEHDDPLG